MKQNMTTIILVALVCCGIGFGGGILYQKSQRPSFNGGPMMGTPGGPNGTNNTQGNQLVLQGSQSVTGEITAVDATSITVKTQNGSSIILVSQSSTISKSTGATKSDMKVGDHITAFGTKNTDGTITADSVSIGTTMGAIPGNNGGLPANK